MLPWDSSKKSKLLGSFPNSRSSFGSACLKANLSCAFGCNNTEVVKNAENSEKKSKSDTSVIHPSERVGPTDPTTTIYLTTVIHLPYLTLCIPSHPAVAPNKLLRPPILNWSSLLWYKNSSHLKHNPSDTTTTLWVTRTRVLHVGWTHIDSE